MVDSSGGEIEHSEAGARLRSLSKHNDFRISPTLRFLVNFRLLEMLYWPNFQIDPTSQGVEPVGAGTYLGLKLWVGVELVINILKDSGEEIDFSDDILNFVTFRPRGRAPEVLRPVFIGDLASFLPFTQKARVSAGETTVGLRHEVTIMLFNDSF